MADDPSPDIHHTGRLVQAAQQGDRDALESLFERYLPRVRHIVRLRLGRSAGRLGDIEDVVQESLMKAMRSLHQFQEGEFRHWITRVVDCVIRDMADWVGAQKRDPARERRLGGGDSLAEFILAGDFPTPSAVLRGKELEERVEHCLLEMPEPQRELIVLRQLYGLSYEDIARELGFEKTATVRVALSRALKRLADRISADD